MKSAEKSILIVDDDADFVEAVSSFLQANGYRILKAHDGRQGVKLARMELPDLIIMDIVMSERTEGFFTVQEIRRIPELKDVPIFVLTSLYSKYADFRIPPDSLWLAHDEFFSKPVNLSEFLKKIRDCIGGEPPAARAPETGEAGT